jgi:hypothetical protein
MKMKLIGFNSDDVPDHVIEEFNNCVLKLLNALAPTIENMPPNLVLGAMNLLYAELFCHLVVENPEEIKKGATYLAKALIQNIEKISNVKIFEDIHNEVK